MSRRRKPDEIKHCKLCGELMRRKRLKNGELESNLHFRKRKYCNRECMKRAFALKVDKASTESNSRASARLRMKYFIGYESCQECGSSENLDVHHIDENPYNNELSNLMLLCRSCHIKTHRKGTVCVICGDKHKGLGYCDKHYQRFKKYGDPHMTKYGRRD